MIYLLNKIAYAMLSPLSIGLLLLKEYIGILGYRLFR